MIEVGAVYWTPIDRPPNGAIVLVKGQGVEGAGEHVLTLKGPEDVLALIRLLEGAFDVAWPQYAALKPAEPEDLARAWPNA